MLFVFINCSFDSPENQRMSKKILSEVRSVYGKKKWEKSVIKDKFPEIFVCIYLFTLEAPELRSEYMALVKRIIKFEDQSRILSLVIFFFYSHGIVSTN